MSRTLLVAAFAGLVSVCAAQAQSYPSRPVTMVVGFSAGGPTDTVARIIGERMGRSLGQTIIVENTTGAGGSIGVGRVARAAPDGYTLSIGHWGTHVLNGAIYSLNYDLLRDLDPVAVLPANPLLVVARKDVPAKNLTELVDWVRAHQDKVTAGTAGAGSATHIGGVYFQNFTKTKLTFVPYRGAGPALLDLVAGTIDIMCDQSSNSLPQVQAKAVKAFAVTAPKRIASAPEIPTVDEAGLPGFYVSIWHGLWVPHGTPADVVAKLTAAVQDALADPSVKSRLAELGQEIPPRELQTPEALGKLQRAEIEKWWPLVKSAGIKAE
ncbi:MAG: tripartite tricarboxylate transporter substrate binding protein BugD [Alphaproteobacteria bacterium]|nr:tripartite tricarboxylate transporter substrate binding protein BugD [Alphaproteobacteria bacterium]